MSQSYKKQACPFTNRLLQQMWKMFTFNSNQATIESMKLKMYTWKEPSKDKAKRICHKRLGLLKKLNCSLFCETSAHVSYFKCNSHIKIKHRV